MAVEVMFNKRSEVLDEPPMLLVSVFILYASYLEFLGPSVIPSIVVLSRNIL